MGELVEAHEPGVPPANVHAGSAERYRVGTLFAATAGSEGFLSDIEHLRVLHRALRDAFSKPDDWEDARTAYVAALHDIEGRLRAVGAAGKLT